MALWASEPNESKAGFDHEIGGLRLALLKAGLGTTNTIDGMLGLLKKLIVVS